MNDALGKLLELCAKHSHRLQKWESAVFQAGFAAGREYQKSMYEGKGHITGKPTRKDLQETLGRYVYLGFRLEEEGDHVLKLYHGDEMIAPFAKSVDVYMLHQACENHLWK